MRTTLLSILVLAFAACGGQEFSETTEAISEEGPVRVVLEVREEGGFVPIEFSIGRMPVFVLMSDGTLYGPGMMTMEFPGRLLPAVQSAVISGQALDEILQYIEDIGMADITKERVDHAMNQIADAPDTVVTFYDDSAHEFSVYALGLDTQNLDVRVALLNELVQRLHLAIGQGEPGPHYQPERIEVLAGVREIPMDPQFENEQPWPLEAPFADMVDAGASWRCVALDGETAAKALEVFDKANAATTWTDEAATYTMVIRYLYPHQAGCGTVG